MADQQFSILDLMNLLVQKVGLAPAHVTDDASVTFADIGLDSLAFLQVSTELHNEYGVELPAEPPGVTVGEIITCVNDHLQRENAA